MGGSLNEAGARPQARSRWDGLREVRPCNARDIRTRELHIPEKAAANLSHLPPVRRVAPGLVAAWLCALPLGAQQLLQDEVGFQPASLIQGSGARAWGMGGAFLARADDATAISWNPAGLSYLRRPEFSAVWLGYRRSGSEVGPGGAFVSDDRLSGQAPDFLSLAYPFATSEATGALQLSYQRVLSFTYDRTIDRSEVLVDIQSQSGFDAVSLGLGLHVGRKIRVGVAVNRWINGQEQELERVFPDRRSQQFLDFDLSGWNANVGLIWSPWESLNVGLVGKTSFEGDVTLGRRRIDEIEDTQRPTVNAFTSDAVELDFPGSVGIGLSWRPRSTLTISADYTRTFWSGSQIFDFFTLGRGGPPGTPPPGPTKEDLYPALPYPSLDDPGQHDTAQLRGGVEYVFLRRRFKIPLRVGIFTDRQYFRPGVNLDRANDSPVFVGFAAGTGLVVGPVLCDVAYVRETGDYSSPQGVRSDVTNRRIMVSVIYRHGATP